jgi:hypothetical protein
MRLRRRRSVGGHRCVDCRLLFLKAEGSKGESRASTAEGEGGRRRSCFSNHAPAQTPIRWPSLRWPRVERERFGLQ